MRKPVTFRLEPNLLEGARALARRENRSLTNLVETVLKKEVDLAANSSNGDAMQSDGKAGN